MSGRGWNGLPAKRVSCAKVSSVARIGGWRAVSRLPSFPLGAGRSSPASPVAGDRRRQGRLARGGPAARAAQLADNHGVLANCKLCTLAHWEKISHWWNREKISHFGKSQTLPSGPAVGKVFPPIKEQTLPFDRWNHLFQCSAINWQKLPLDPNCQSASFALWQKRWNAMCHRAEERAKVWPFPLHGKFSLHPVSFPVRNNLGA